MFDDECDTIFSSWKNIGDISAGRPNLGPTTQVGVYRIFQYALRDELIHQFGIDVARRIFRDTGKTVGLRFCSRLLNVHRGFNVFVADLQEKLKTLGMGILRVEEADLENLKFTLTVAEDLDCSGLPVSKETRCEYDEGFIAGVIEGFAGVPVNAREVDCWASGGRVCRFEATAADRGDR